MTFSVEQIRSVMSPQVEAVDSSMYASASDNDHLVKEISKLEMEKKQQEQEVEQLRKHNQKLVNSNETLERKLHSLADEKTAEVRMLEKQVEDMTKQLSKSEKSAVEEKLNISNKLEEKCEETLTLKGTLEANQKELEQYKLLAKEKEELLWEQMIEYKHQELKMTELLGIKETMVKEKNVLLDTHAKDIAELTNKLKFQVDECKKQELKITELLATQEAIVKEKDALLDHQAKNITELINKLKMNTENIEIERNQRSMADADRLNLEEKLKELQDKLSHEKATCEYYKSKLEKNHELEQLKIVHQEKNLELSRVENQLLELQSVISNLRDDKIYLNTENNSLNNIINALRAEIKEKAMKISTLELSVTDLNHKLHDTNERYCEMERNYTKQLVDKEQVINELTKLQEGLNGKLQAEARKLKRSEEEIDKLTVLLEVHEKNELEFKEKNAKLEKDAMEKHIKLNSVILELKNVKERAALSDKMQEEKIAKYQSDISLMREANNKKIDSLSSQLKDYMEQSETQAKTIAQYESDILLLKDSSSKEFEEKDSAIVEKERMIENLERQNSELGMRMH